MRARYVSDRHPWRGAALTRRAALGGLAMLPFAAAAAPATEARRLGWPAGLGLEGAFEDGGGVRAPSVGALRDALAAGIVDVALLPLSTPDVAFLASAPLLPPVEAWLLCAPAGTTAAPVLARPAPDRVADAALLRLWRTFGIGGVPDLLALAPGPACANVAVGRLAAALLFGTPPAVPAGCRLLRLGREPALRPALGLARAPLAGADAAVLDGRFVSPGTFRGDVS